MAADWNWAMRPTEKKRITGLEWKLLSSDGEGKERQREASPKVESTCSFNLDMEIMKLSPIPPQPATPSSPQPWPQLAELVTLSQFF